MDIRQVEPNVLLLPLPGEPQLRPELALARETVSRMEGMHVVVDFTRVEIITSPTIGSLLLLKETVSQWGGRLILCNLRLVTKCILRTAGLDMCFEFAADKFTALKALHEFTGATTGSSRADL
jgi:anti-anti-sigma regulatory factor